MGMVVVLFGGRRSLNISLLGRHSSEEALKGRALFTGFTQYLRLVSILTCHCSDHCIVIFTQEYAVIVVQIKNKIRIF